MLSDSRTGQAALGYREAEACVVRKGRNGVEREHAAGFVVALPGCESRLA